MNKLNFLPTTIYKFDSSIELSDHVLEKVKNLDMVANESNHRSVTDLFFDEKLYQWLEECIDKAKHDIGIPDSVKLTITSCWANRTNKMNAHHSHTHPNSFMSGVYYLTDGHTGGETIFITQNTWMKNFDWLDFQNGKNFSVSQNFIPKRGTLLLFPSSVKHNVTGLRNNSERYSISFNTFFCGTVSNDDQKLTRLSISSRSVRDYYNET